MKKITALLVLLCSCLAGFSQRVYFVYLQSEGNQPFFLKMNEQVYSSNSSGYLILSKLKDSTYQFSVGFPQNRWPEQTFTVPVRGKDLGFLLKNTAGQSWSLVDLQTNTRIDGELPVRSRSFKTEPRQVSAFTDVLSRAANDPSLKERVVPVEQPVVRKEVKKTDEVPAQMAVAPASKDSAPNLANTAPHEPAATTEPNPQTWTKDTATKVAINQAVQSGGQDSSQRKQEVASLTPVTIDTSTVTTTASAQTASPGKPVVDGNDDAKDKIDSTQQKPSSENSLVDTLARAQTAKPEKKEENITDVYRPSRVSRRTESSTTEGFGITYVDEYPDGNKDTIRIMIPNPKQVTRNVPPPQEEGQFLPMDSEAKDLTPVKKEPAGAKNDCTGMASETDYLKLRKKMVATDGDDAMLAAAKKVFKTKCFTTEQIRNLGTLFLNDAGRYHFFDAAYLSTSDRAGFAALESELKDAYYISRFKAMLR